MASYHLSVKILSRSSGRSAVAAASYRSRSKILDERQGLEFEYTQKKDLLHAEILTPDNAPAWMMERATLWNGVERAEKRKDAQLMREVEIALPMEINDSEKIRLVREFCQQNFVSRGMVADFCIHNAPNNPHAHIMLTMREINEEGFGKKVREWNGKENLLTWREAWANIQNSYLAKTGFDIRVDHRSYVEQGISVEPQVKQGPIVHADGDYQFERADDYQRIAHENGQRIIQNPGIALDHLTKMQSTFTHDDILKYIHAHCNDAQFYAAVQSVTDSPELIKIEENEYDRFSRYTTRSLLRIESRMLENASRMGDGRHHSISDRYIKQASTACCLSDEQKNVLEQISKGGDLCAVVGHAGTGKSYTLRAVREAFESQGCTVQGIALAGVAAEGLETSSGIHSTTIHRKLFDWDNGRSRLDNKSVLVIDEAGMVGTRQMDRILAEANNAGAKVIVVGDTKQTQAVEAGGAFRGILERVETSRLSEVWRQKKDWQKEATRLLSGDRASIHQALDMYHKEGYVARYDRYDLASESMLDFYVQHYSAESTSVMIAHRNEDVDRLNTLCRNDLRTKTDLLGQKETKVATTTGLKAFSNGDRVLFLRNEKSIGVKNGTFGTVERFDENGNINVALSNDRHVVVNTQFYKDLTYGYAATIHKLQGATVDRAFVLASEGMDRHTAYVAMSRHQKYVRLYYSTDKFQNFEDLKIKFSNLGDKELLVDYKESEDPIEAALQRLTRSEATFTDKELASLPSDITDDGRFLRGIMPVGEGANGEIRFSTPAMIATEQSMFSAAGVLSTNQKHSLTEEHFNRVLSAESIGHDNRLAIRKALMGQDLTLINCEHGSNRGYAAGVIARTYQKEGYVVEGLSLSGMGAMSLQNESGIESMTVFKKIWEWEQGRNLPSDKSVFILDNASMIGTRQTEKILAHAERAKAKVVMFGDKQFLQALSAGDAYRGLNALPGVSKATLSSSMDRHVKWQHEALELIEKDTVDGVGRALDLFAENGAISQSGKETVASNMVSDWLSDVQQSKTYAGRVMMAYANRDVDRINVIARDQLKDIGYVSPIDQTVATAEKGQLSFAAGDRIIFLRKDNDLGVQSGSLGTLRNIDGHRLSVKLDTGTVIAVDTRLYNDLNHGYAVSVFRSAGMKSENAYVMATTHFNRNATKAALQGNEKSVRLYHSFENHEQLKATLSRSKKKDLAADYPLRQRAFEITVDYPERLFSTHVKTIIMDPEADIDVLKSKLRKEAHHYADNVVRTKKLKKHQIKGMDIKVREVDLGQALEKQAAKDMRHKQRPGKEM